MTALLQVQGLVRDYRLPRRRLLQPAPQRRALFGVDLEIREGESFGVVGESGCGKSTLARTVVALEPPSAGRVRFRGQDLFALPPAGLRKLRRHFQMVFQDPYGSLDPRHRVARIVAEPLDALGGDALMAEGNPDKLTRFERIVESLGAVGLKPGDAAKYPHEFSGGQRQRIALARALITRPELIVADEPVSALDVSVQAQVLNLMMDLQARFGLAYLFISHDLSVVRTVTQQVAVMYLGRIVEQGTTQEVFTAPAHPYTQALVAAVPRPDPARRRRPKAVMREHQPVNPTVAQGCPYATRCPLVQARCREERPELRALGSGRKVACHLA